MEIKYQNLRVLGPAILKVKIPDEILNKLNEYIDKIINDNREKAIEYKQGKEKLFGFFVGQAMKASGGKANPQLINEILKKKL